MAAVDSLTWSVPSLGPQNLPDAQPATPAAHHGFSFHEIFDSLNPFHHQDASGTQASTGDNHHGFTFHDVLNIVNPLQHLPVIGTLYRAITGDQINTFDKIAGDTLYGGTMGFASAMADTVFKAVTGKYFGEEMLALVFGDPGSADTGVAQATTPSSSTQVAQATSPSPQAIAANAIIAPTASAVSPTQVAQATTQVQPVPFVQPESAIATFQQPDLSALQQSLLKNGIDPLLAQRATYAYQRATGLSQRPITTADAGLPAP